MTFRKVTEAANRLRADSRRNRLHTSQFRELRLELLLRTVLHLRAAKDSSIVIIDILICSLQMAMNRCLFPLSVAIILGILTPRQLNASSVYYADMDKLEFINDDNPQTYLSLSSSPACQVSLFSDKLNLYPSGKGYGDKKYSVPMSDEDPFRKPVIDKIRAWKSLSSKQKIAALLPNAHGVDTSCILAAEKEFQKEYLKQAQVEKLCTAKGKTSRITKRGRLCLSDFEFAQLEILEEKNYKSEQQNYSNQDFHRQQQDQFLEQQRQQHQQNLQQQQGQMVLDMIQRSKPRYCYGTSYGGYSGIRTYNASCY